jgi:molybdate transport system ATP-binding protein
MSLEVRFRRLFPQLELDVAFEIETGGITALFGPSGAGKTSIANTIAGLLKPSEGRIALNGRELFDSERDICLPPQQRRVGYVFQEARLFPHLSVEKNLRFGWRRAAQPPSEDEYARIVELLGISHLLARKPRTLSGGERSRVALGRALLASPEVLLLDEPLAALDAPRKHEIMPWLERLRDETRIPVLYISHSLEEVARLADRVILLKEGHVAASGSVFDLLTDFAFAEFTGGAPYGTLLNSRVARHLESDGLTALSFPGGELFVPVLARSPGSQLRVHIRAEDVILARERPGAISANNVLPTVIANIHQVEAFADVRLTCGATTLVARITRASCNRLGLHEGDAVFAIVKSVTVSPQIDNP